MKEKFLDNMVKISLKFIEKVYLTILYLLYLWCRGRLADYRSIRCFVAWPSWLCRSCNYHFKFCTGHASCRLFNAFKLYCDYLKSCIFLTKSVNSTFNYLSVLLFVCVSCVGYNWCRGQERTERRWCECHVLDYLFVL